MNVTTEISQSKVKHKSFTYQVNLAWLENKAGNLGAEGKPSFRVSSPPEFKGEPGVWSPEDLFVAAVNVCTMTTFISFASRLQLPIVSYESSAEGTLEFVDGGYRFTKIVLKPAIVVKSADSISQVEKTLNDAHHSCLIANSIKAEVFVEPTIVV